MSTPILNPPQVGILGSAQDRAEGRLPVNGEVVIRQMMYVRVVCTTTGSSMPRAACSSWYA